MTKQAALAWWRRCMDEARRHREQALACELGLTPDPWRRREAAYWLASAARARRAYETGHSPW